MRGLAQPCKRFMQSSCEFFIHISDLTKQTLNHNTQSPREFGGVQLSDERTFEWLCHFARQLVHAAAVDSGKTVANAGQRQRVVADTTYHVFRLP